MELLQGLGRRDLAVLVALLDCLAINTLAIAWPRS